MRAAKAILFLWMLLGAVVSGCSPGEVEGQVGESGPSLPDQTSERPGDSIEVLLSKIGKSYDEVTASFSDGFEDDVKDRLLKDSHQRWRKRFNDCADARCRHKLARQELNRLNFAIGRAAEPIVGLPFRNGRFESKEENFSGGLNLLPLDNNLLLMNVSSVTNDLRGICFFNAYGPPPAPAAALMKLTDKDAAVRIEVQSNRELSLSLAKQGKDVDSWPCTSYGDVYGKYALME